MKYVLILVMLLTSMTMTSCGSKPNSHSAYHKIVRSMKQKKRLKARRIKAPVRGKQSILSTFEGNWNKISFGGNRDRK